MPETDVQNTQRRRFSRVGFRAPCQLTIDGRVFDCTVLDMSLKGALVALDVPEEALPPLHSPCTLDVQLGEGHDHISMLGNLVHSNQQQLGIHCTELDIDSATTLRRLVELNLADPPALERNLRAMLEDSLGHGADSA